MDSMFSEEPSFWRRRGPLVVSLLIASILIVNLFLWGELRRTNTLLIQMRNDVADMREDMVHVKEDVESNAETLDLVVDLLGGEPE